MKRLSFILLFLLSIATFGNQAMPLFNELPAPVRQDIRSELTYELNLNSRQLQVVVSQIVLVADITRAMPGIDQAYLAIVEDKNFGEVRARFDIGIVYGTQGSSSGLVANLINYSINP